MRMGGHTMKEEIRHPNCPFAEDAWEDDRVRVMDGGKRATILQLNMWDDSVDVVVVTPVEWVGWYDWCLLSESHWAEYDLIAIPNARDGYILLQRLSTLVEASEGLMASGYYDDYTKEQFDHVMRRRGLSRQWPSL